MRGFTYFTFTKEWNIVLKYDQNSQKQTQKKREKEYLTVTSSKLGDLILLVTRRPHRENTHPKEHHATDFTTFSKLILSSKIA